MLFLTPNQQCQSTEQHATNVHEKMMRIRKLSLGPDLQNILRQSYDYLTIGPNAKVTIDLRRTSNLQNILQRMLDFS